MCSGLNIGSIKNPSRIWAFETHPKMRVEPDFRFRSSVVRNRDFAESEFPEICLRYVDHKGVRLDWHTKSLAD